MSIYYYFRTLRDKYLFGKHKLKYFKNIQSPILELGAGNGVNFRYYAEKSNVTVIEPNAGKHLGLKKLALRYNLNIKIYSDTQELYRMKSSTYKSVIGSLVLCSIEDQEKCLREIKSVLTENGIYHFLEHISSKDGTIKHYLQKLFQTTWYKISQGCNCCSNFNSNVLKVFPNAQLSHFHLRKLTLPITNNYMIGSIKKEL